MQPKPSQQIIYLINASPEIGIRYRVKYAQTDRDIIPVVDEMGRQRGMMDRGIWSQVMHSAPIIQVVAVFPGHGVAPVEILNLLLG